MVIKVLNIDGMSGCPNNPSAGMVIIRVGKWLGMRWNIHCPECGISVSFFGKKTWQLCLMVFKTLIIITIICQDLFVHANIVMLGHYLSQFLLNVIWNVIVNLFPHKVVQIRFGFMMMLVVYPCSCVKVEAASFLWCFFCMLDWRGKM